MACLSKSFFLFQSKSSSSDEKEAPAETECEPEKTSEYVHISIFDLPGIVVTLTNTHYVCSVHTYEKPLTISALRFLKNEKILTLKPKAGSGIYPIFFSPSPPPPCAHQKVKR